MDLRGRISKVEDDFEQHKATREEHLRLAELELTEMTKLQGEWRVLDELSRETKKSNKKVSTIEAVPEEDK